ncbi:hypothetical protein [Pelagibius sp. Alg239-R121]|uniref:hypothetical protein n=1 Tax=Pelagibius sp. Alg239-R121 TaxID=2993448 RepID=UPI0024A67D2F|nr:hypothetical protein [Pelagibius sp. Alg239-R121]
MASIAEFLELLSEDTEKAFRTYFFNIDGSLDGDEMVLQECRRQKVCFEFQEPNKIVMRAPGGKEAKYGNEIWYLPWMRSGTSKAHLDGSGPPFFSTSQLDGCRFTIRYHNDSRTRVTVLHVAGDVPGGSKQRDGMETKAGLKASPHPRRTRRYSVSRGAKSATEKVGEDFKLRYDGNKASVFGFRDCGGVWHFYAQQMMKYPDEADRPPLGRAGKGIRELSAG